MQHDTVPSNANTSRRSGILWRIALAAALANLAVAFMGGRWPLNVIGGQLSSPGIGWSFVLLVGAAIGSRWSTRSAMPFDWRRSRRLPSLLWRFRSEAMLALLVGVGLVVRFWGRDYGLPLVLHPDEPGVVAISAAMLRKGTLDPNWFIYPTLYLYLILPLMALAYLSGRAAGGMGELARVSHLEPGFLQAARSFSAVAGAATLVPVYKTATTLWEGSRGKRAGLIAAAIVAFSFIHVRESHLAVTDTTLTLLLALSLLATARVLRNGTNSSYAWAGLAGGLAGAAKYSALPIVAVILSAHLLGRPRREWLSRKPLVALAGLGAGFLVGAPYSLMNWPAFLNHLGLLTTIGSGSDPHNRLLWMFWYGMESGFGPFITIGTTLAVVVALFRRDKRELLLVIYVVVFIAQVTHARINVFPRYWLPAMPGIALLFAGYLVQVVGWVQERFRLRPAIGAALLTGLATISVWPTAVETITWSRARARLYAPTLAYEWILDSMPKGTIVATESRMVAAPSHVDFFWYRTGVHHRDIGAWRRDGVDLMVLIDDAEQDSQRPPAARRLRRQLKRRLDLVQTFPASDGINGPTVEVYRVRYLATNLPSTDPDGDAAEDGDSQ